MSLLFQTIRLLLSLLIDPVVVFVSYLWYPHSWTRRKAYAYYRIAYPCLTSESFASKVSTHLEKVANREQRLADISSTDTFKTLRWGLGGGFAKALTVWIFWPLAMYAGALAIYEGPWQDYANAHPMQAAWVRYYSALLEYKIAPLIPRDPHYHPPVSRPVPPS